MQLDKKKFRNTSRYPDEEVRRLVEFAFSGGKDINFKTLGVSVKNCSRCYAGRAYNYVTSLSPFWNLNVYRMVTLRIGGPERFPVHQHWYGQKYKRVESLDFMDWREALVYLAAHELRHIYQFQHHRQVSEVDAERFAAKALKRFRGSAGRRLVESLEAKAVKAALRGIQREVPRHQWGALAEALSAF